MRLPRQPALPVAEATIPLVNVAFLLLAFFMVIGRMDATAPFEVLPPQSDYGTTLPQGGVTVSIAGSGALALDGTAADLDGIIGQVASGTEFVRINAHAEAALGDVLPVVAAIEAASVPRVVLVVTPRDPGER